MASRLSRRRALYASAGTALAVLATVTAVATGPAAASAGAAGAAAAALRTLSAAPLGVNVAQWDYIYYAPGSVQVIQPLLKKAGIRHFRYGGGSLADAYDWKTSTDIIG